MANKILVVDDDLYIRELYEEVLKNAGYDVETAVDGVDGLQKLKVGGFDLVYLDVVMPKLDGKAVLAELAKSPPLKKNGHVILLSNLGNDPVTQEAIKTGATSYLTKADITPDQLLAYTKKYLAQT